MSAKSALAAQLDALMGKERNVPVDQVPFLAFFPSASPSRARGLLQIRERQLAMHAEGAALSFSAARRFRSSTYSIARDIVSCLCLIKLS